VHPIFTGMQMGKTGGWGAIARVAVHGSAELAPAAAIPPFSVPRPCYLSDLTARAPQHVVDVTFSGMSKVNGKVRAASVFKCCENKHGMASKVNG
jgi:hypothetical protein